MADQQQAEPKAEEKQPAPMPSADQTQVSSKEAEASPKGDSQTQQPKDDLQLPSDAKERTAEQFEKLKKQLAEERSRRVRMEQVFTRSTQKPVEQPKPDDSPFPDYYNPETGEVDVVKLNQREKSIQQQLQQLNQRTQAIAEAEMRKQEDEAFNAYPELNPNGDSFNEAFHRAVSGALTDAFLKGENPTFKQVADQIADFADKRSKQAEKAGASKALEQLTPKEQAAMEATGRSDRRGEVISSLDELQKRTRTGDLNAIVERMKNIPAA